MNIPRFTAVNSIYKSTVSYRSTAGALNGSEHIQGVLPQALLDCLRSCYTELNFGGPDLFEACRESCYHGKFTDDGGIKPAPGPARDTPPPPDFICYPCRHGKKLCGLPGQGLRSYPC
jgi:hypothetical protein